MLAESAVIDEYLDERYPEPSLWPADPAERGVLKPVHPIRAADGQKIGQQPSPEIDPAERQQPPAKQAIKPGLFLSIGHERDDRHRERGKLDPGVKPAERIAAMTAAAARHQPADQGHEIARGQPRAA